VSYAARLVHRLALVAPSSAPDDPEVAADLDDHGHVVMGEPTVTLLRGLVQPRRAEEVAAISQAGVELSDHVIYLDSRVIPPGAYLADADASGIVSGGRRFDIVGVRSFEYGRTPHLEVDVRLVGRTEGPALGS
jgi:hypothetical protein